MLYAFLLSADPASCGCEVLAEKFLDRKLGTSADMRADCALELYLKLEPQIDERGFRQIYEEIDLPLADVLRRMERTGIRVEPAQLAALSERMDADMQRLAEQIHAIAGAPFNINSPQQLAKVLYDDLKLPSPVKYGKGKTTSTAADILEALAAEHEIARLVLDYRQLAKLKGTYVDALPALIRTGQRPPAHDLQSGRRGDRPALFLESESAEHPDPDGTGPRDPCRVRASGGLGAGGRRLFADRASAARAHVARSAAGQRVPQRRGYSHAYRGRGVRDAAADGDAGNAAERQSRQLRDRLWPDAVGVWRRSSASTAKKRKSISATTLSGIPA